jgi:RNA-directed DNA polymerase
VEKKMTEAPEPKDKLDAATALATAVSGPEDAALHWRQVDRRRAEADVRRLRQRIFTASKAGDLKRVRRLQKLMLRWVEERAYGRVSATSAARSGAGAKECLVDREGRPSQPSECSRSAREC